MEDLSDAPIEKVSTSDLEALLSYQQTELAARIEEINSVADAARILNDVLVGEQIVRGEGVCLYRDPSDPSVGYLDEMALNEAYGLLYHNVDSNVIPGNFADMLPMQFQMKLRALGLIDDSEELPQNPSISIPGQ